MTSRARPGVSRPSISIIASACGVHRSMTRSASSSSRLPTSGFGSSDIDCATDVTAITRSPRRRAPRAISTGTADRPPAEKTIITSRRPEGEVGEDDLGQARHALDEHRLALAVGADDLRVEGHRQLDDGVEARIRAVAREHLLDRDARVAGAEEMDEPVGRDGLRAPLAGLFDGVRLGRLETLEKADGLGQPWHPPAGRAGRAASTRTGSATSVATIRRAGRGGRWQRRRPRVPGSRRGWCSWRSRRRASRRGP